MTAQELSRHLHWSLEIIEETLSKDGLMHNQVDASGAELMQNAELLGWIWELCQKVETVFSRRRMMQLAVEFYRHAGGNWEEIRAAMEAKPYSTFSALDLLPTGALHAAFDVATYALDRPEGERLRGVNSRNPFFNPDEPRHMMKPQMVHILAGNDGEQTAARLKEHIAQCEGCRLNFEHEDRFEGFPAL